MTLEVKKIPYCNNDFNMKQNSTGRRGISYTPDIKCDSPKRQLEIQIYHFTIFGKRSNFVKDV